MSQEPKDLKPGDIFEFNPPDTSLENLVHLEDNHPDCQSLEVQIALDQFFSGVSERPLVEWLARKEGLDPSSAILRSTPMKADEAHRSKMSLVGPVDVLVDLEEHYRDRMQIDREGSASARRVLESKQGSQSPSAVTPDLATLHSDMNGTGRTTVDSEYEAFTFADKDIRKEFGSDCKVLEYEDLQQGEIRLLHWDELAVTLETVRLEDAPPYFALSYVWGSTERITSLYCNGQVLPITRNLAVALNALFYRYEKAYVWVDAICINQENISERNQQVLLMAEIFRKAELVLAHLKEPAQSGVESADWPAVSLMNYLNRIWYFDADYSLKQDSEWERLKIPRPDEKIIWNTLILFWINPWFTRAWILQEAVLGRNVVLFFGDAVISLNAVTRFWDLAQRRDMPQILKHGLLADLHAVSRNVGQIGTIKKLRDLREGSKTNPDVTASTKLLIESDINSSDPAKLIKGGTALLELLIMSSAAASSDRRDKVYSMLGLAEDEVAKSIRPDYSDENTVTKVYTDVAVRYIEVGFGAEILHNAGNYRLVTGLPSWAPDWSHQPRSRFNPKLYDCSGPSQASFKLSDDKAKLTVRGTIIDTIKIAGLPCRYYDLNEWHDKFHSMKIIDRKPPVETDQEMRQIVHNFGQTLVHLCCSEETYPEGLDLAHGRTLTADTTWSGQRSDSAFLESYDAYRRLSEFASNPPEGTTGEEPGSKVRNQPRMGFVHRFEPTEEAALREKAWPYEAAMQEIQKGRRTCFTKSGRMCTATHDSEAGDWIVMVEGCAMPMVLRLDEEGKKEFTLMGDCYLHGVMDGELIVGDVDEYVDGKKVGIDREGRRYAVKSPKGGLETFVEFVIV